MMNAYFSLHIENRSSYTHKNIFNKWHRSHATFFCMFNYRFFPIVIWRFSSWLLIEVSSDLLELFFSRAPARSLLIDQYKNNRVLSLMKTTPLLRKERKYLVRMNFFQWNALLRLSGGHPNSIELFFFFSLS